jgi:hypothetical protein
MPMVGQVQALSEGGYGFVVTKDNNRPADRELTLTAHRPCCP